MHSVLLSSTINSDTRCKKCIIPIPDFWFASLSTSTDVSQSFSMNSTTSLPKTQLFSEEGKHKVNARCINPNHHLVYMLENTFPLKLSMCWAFVSSQNLYVEFFCLWKQILELVHISNCIYLEIVFFFS